MGARLPQDCSWCQNRIEDDAVPCPPQCHHDGVEDDRAYCSRSCRNADHS